MLKLIASIPKELPIEDLDYSSRSASAGIEAAMPSAATS